MLRLFVLPLMIAALVQACAPDAVRIVHVDAGGAGSGGAGGRGGAASRAMDAAAGMGGTGMGGSGMGGGAGSGMGGGGMGPMTGRDGSATGSDAVTDVEVMDGAGGAAGDAGSDAGAGRDGGMDAAGGRDAGMDVARDMATGPWAGKDILLVGGPANASGGDIPVRDRLRMGGAVVQYADDAANPNLTGKALIVISNSATASGAKYAAAVVPVICLEDRTFDNLRMVGSVAGTDYGEETGQTQIAITAPAHKLAAGLTGSMLAVAASAGNMTWGVPTASAVKVATIVNMPGRAAIFAYDKDATMVTGTAPARRVGMFITQGLAPNLEDTTGWKLFDAAVNWAMGLPQ